MCILPIGFLVFGRPPSFGWYVVVMRIYAIGLVDVRRPPSFGWYAAEVLAIPHWSDPTTWGVTPPTSGPSC